MICDFRNYLLQFLLFYQSIFKTVALTLAVMDTEVTWIIDALAHDRTKTKSGLADALGVDPSAITRLLHGERRLKYAEARRAADYLGVALPRRFDDTGADEVGFREDAAVFDHRSAPSDPAFAPLFRALTNGDGFWRLDRQSIIERKPRSPQLSGVRDAFGFYAPDNAMAPRFKIGEVAWINPARPVAPGDDALLMRTAQDNDTVFLCELGAIEDRNFIVRQHGDGEEKSFARAQWVALHVFPRS